MANLRNEPTPHFVLLCLLVVLVKTLHLAFGLLRFQTLGTFWVEPAKKKHPVLKHLMIMMMMKIMTIKTMTVMKPER